MDHALQQNAPGGISQVLQRQQEALNQKTAGSSITMTSGQPNYLHIPPPGMFDFESHFSSSGGSSNEEQQQQQQQHQPISQDDLDMLLLGPQSDPNFTKDGFW